MPQAQKCGSLVSMQCKLHKETEPARAQLLAESWQGERVEPPFHFCFTLTAADTLRFEAWRAAGAVVHPAAVAGAYQEELWRYDVVEFFIATADARRYMEFNLSPNGAWWAEGFTEPRVKLAGFDARSLRPTLRAEMQTGRWHCSAELPLAELRRWGWLPWECRLAACAVICRAGEYTYLTSCDERSGKPDFHHPWDWEPALLTQ